MSLPCTLRPGTGEVNPQPQPRPQKFVVARSGREALVRLIQANGDTAAVLGLSPRAFEEAWYAFVRERYLR